MFDLSRHPSRNVLRTLRTCGRTVLRLFPRRYLVRSRVIEKRPGVLPEERITIAIIVSWVSQTSLFLTAFPSFRLNRPPLPFGFSLSSPPPLFLSLSLYLFFLGLLLVFPSIRPRLTETYLSHSTQTLGTTIHSTWFPCRQRPRNPEPARRSVANESFMRRDKRLPDRTAARKRTEGRSV